MAFTFFGHGFVEPLRSFVILHTYCEGLVLQQLWCYRCVTLYRIWYLSFSSSGSLPVN